MIVLDTHIWVWWVHRYPRLTSEHLRQLEAFEVQGLGVSAISCWEVAKLVEGERLELSRPVEEWLSYALSYPGVVFLPLTPAIAVESARLPGEFHRDPADQIIVATARVHQCRLATADRKILLYPHVECIDFSD